MLIQRGINLETELNEPVDKLNEFAVEIGGKFYIIWFVGLTSCK